MADLSQRALAESGHLDIWDKLNSGRMTQAQAQAALGGGGSSGNTGATNYIDIAKQMYEMANQQRQPAIQTLQGGRAGIGTAYGGLVTQAQAQKPLLTQQYQNLLADVTKTTREAAGQEYTRRGIPLSSGVVEQTVGSRLAPQIANIGQQTAVGMQGVDQLVANLGMQQQGAYQNLDQAVAAIQAGASPEAITSAQNIYNQQQQAQQQTASLALQQQIANQNAAYQQAQLAQKNYITLPEGNTLFDPTTGKIILKTAKTYAPSENFGFGTTNNRYQIIG